MLILIYKEGNFKVHPIMKNSSALHDINFD